MSKPMIVCVGGQHDGQRYRFYQPVIRLPVPDSRSADGRILTMQSETYYWELIAFPDQQDVMFYRHESLSPHAAVSLVFAAYAGEKT